MTAANPNAGRRLPWAPLLERVVSSTGRPLHQTPDCPYCFNVKTIGYACLTGARIAEILGVTLYAVRQWERLGVPYFQADRAAIRLGHHPAAVWYVEWFNELETVA